MRLEVHMRKQGGGMQGGRGVSTHSSRSSRGGSRVGHRGKEGVCSRVGMRRRQRTLLHPLHTASAIRTPTCTLVRGSTQPLQRQGVRAAKKGAASQGGSTHHTTPHPPDQGRGQGRRGAAAAWVAGPSP